VGGTVALIDADYDRLLGTLPNDPDLVITDTHDVETTLLRSHALDHVLRELGDRSRMAVTSPRQCLLDAASIIGAARLVCRRLGWSVQFEGLDYEDIVDAKTLRVAPTELLRTLRGRQARAQPEARITDDAEELIAQELARGHSPWDLCQGHDVVAILGLALRRVLGTRLDSELRPARLEMELRLAFDSADFKASAIHALFSAWEARNPGFKVL
jgi:hypothetical protein